MSSPSAGHTGPSSPPDIYASTKGKVDVSNFKGLISVLLMLMPMILPAAITVACLMNQQHLKAFLFLFFILAFMTIREFFVDFMPTFGKQRPRDPDCNIILYSRKANEGASTFLISYVVAYVLLPMMLFNKSVFDVIALLIIVLFLDIFLNLTKGCISLPTAFLNMLGGFCVGGLNIYVMMNTNMSAFFFYNEVSTTTDMCAVPSTQEFKCKTFLPNGVQVA